MTTLAHLTFAALLLASSGDDEDARLNDHGTLAETAPQPNEPVIETTDARSTDPHRSTAPAESTDDDSEPVPPALPVVRLDAPKPPKGALLADEVLEDQVAAGALTVEGIVENTSPPEPHGYEALEAAEAAAEAAARDAESPPAPSTTTAGDAEFLMAPGATLLSANLTEAAPPAGAEPEPDEELGDGATFVRQRGKLQRPARGQLVTHFGALPKEPLHKHVRLPSRGVEFATPVASEVRAIHRGRIVFASTFRRFGTLIVLDHGGGYHSVYGNVRPFGHDVGEIVEAGAIIGMAGAERAPQAPPATGVSAESPVATVTPVYFELRYRGEALNPADWLTTERVAARAKP